MKRFQITNNKFQIPNNNSSSNTKYRCREFLISVIGIYLLFGFCGLGFIAYAQPLAIPDGKHCDECGMIVDRNSKFANEVIDEKGGKLFFCDLGDMFYHFRTSKNTIRTVYVRDYASGEWINGRKARYVRSKKIETPMSWGIAAFGSDAEAMKWGVPIDFDSAFALPSAILKERMK